MTDKQKIQDLKAAVDRLKLGLRSLKISFAILCFMFLLFSASYPKVLLLWIMFAVWFAMIVYIIDTTEKDVDDILMEEEKYSESVLSKELEDRFNANSRN